MWERARLFLEKLSLGSSASCSNRSTRSLQTPKTRWIGLFWDKGTEHNIPYMESLQTNRLLRVFPLPQGCDFALISLVGIFCILHWKRDFRASNRNIQLQMVLQSAWLLRRNDLLPSSGSLFAQLEHPFHQVHEMSSRDSYSEDVPYLSSSCRRLPSSTKDVVSTLSFFQKLAATIPRSQLTRPLLRHQPKASSFVWS
jgi:hypothetical protein